MVRLWTATLACAAILGACHKQTQPATKAGSEPSAVVPASPWQDTSTIDSMTDKVTHGMTVTNGTGASLTVACDDAGERVSIESDLILGSRQLGTVLLRFDNAKPMDEDAFFNNNLALFYRPKKLPSLQEGADRYLYEFGSYVVMMYLREPHDRLRVRLISANGDTRDLDFNIKGNEPKLMAIETQCGITNDRPGQQKG